ncbi:transcriptional regulator [Nitratireductor aquibiodomus RA22]|uniref:Transcriptional regulator n=1 Tax=Nitratireductor aquibiodomus RA22 TaxID=1189611 RepID=I5C5C7_9HYPH|nr:helix-turn-helix transcriptional regulator [Nitratireductor aquibiodomus]EIM77029.1 transcriptional regulator [Nitratireductor aquibiodomus RA22]
MMDMQTQPVRSQPRQGFQGGFVTESMSDTCAIVADLEHCTNTAVALQSHYAQGFLSSRHKHRRGQISYCKSGMMLVMTDEGTIIVPPGHFIWIPPNMYHQAQAQDGMCMMSIYVDHGLWPDLPGSSEVFHASDLFECLMQRMIEVEEKGALSSSTFDAIVTLIRDEIGMASRLDMSMPMPRDRRLARICNAILREPTVLRGKDELARIGNVSHRTMTRLFQTELKMTYSEWCQQALILNALARLAAGDPVTTVAMDLGYVSPSAFSAMFRRRVGCSPKEFAKQY